MNRHSVGWRAARGALGSLALFLAVFATLAWFDPRVGDRLSHLARAAPDDGTERVRATAAVVIAAVREQSLEHAPLVIFALVAAVLVLSMLRT